MLTSDTAVTAVAVGVFVAVLAFLWNENIDDKYMSVAGRNDSHKVCHQRAVIPQRAVLPRQDHRSYHLSPLVLLTL